MGSGARRGLRAAAIVVLGIGTTGACATVLGIDGDYYEVETSPPISPDAPDAPVERDGGASDGEIGAD